MSVLVRMTEPSLRVVCQCKILKPYVLITRCRIFISMSAKKCTEEKCSHSVSLAVRVQENSPEKDSKESDLFIVRGPDAKDSVYGGRCWNWLGIFERM
jgi:hypothetical protein